MKIAVLCALILGLAGCATKPSPAFQEHQRYIQSERPKAVSGEIKWSTYYEGNFERARAANAPGYVLRHLNALIAYSYQYESGQITLVELQQRQREFTALAADEGHKLVREQEAANQRQQAIGVAQMAAGLQMMAASQPQPVVIPAAQPAAPAPGNAYVTGYLRNSTQNGNMRYCNYSNGAVITIASHQLCPQSTK